MAIIRVDPPILFQSSGSIQKDAQGLETAGKGAHRSAEGAPSYDGQFGPRVKAIGSDALGRGGNLSGQLRGLAGNLTSRAQAFEAADNASAAGLISPFNVTDQGWQNARFLARMAAWIKQYPMLAALLKLGLLSFPVLWGTTALAKSSMTFLPKASGLAIGGLVSKIVVPFGTMRVATGKFGSALLKADKSFLSLVQDFSSGRTVFKETFPDLYPALSKGIPYRGQMDKFLKSNWGSGLIDGVITVHDITEDIHDGRYGGDLIKIVGSNVVELGVEKALVYLVPGTKVVLLGNAVVQIGGDLQIGVQRTISGLVATDHNMQNILLADAANVEAAVDKMDIPNIFDSIGGTVVELGENVVELNTINLQSMNALLDGDMEVLADSLQTFSQHEQEIFRDLGGGLLETGRSALNVIDGAADYIDATQASVSNIAIAGGAKMGFIDENVAAGLIEEIHKDSEVKINAIN